MAFARAHMTNKMTYHCVPSLMFAMCMLSDSVIYKSNMQGDEVHMARTSRNPMQSAVILSVNSTIPEGPKDGIHKAKHNFNAACTFKGWLPTGSSGGTSKNLHNGVGRAFERIKGTINLTLSSHTARAVMLELHGEFQNHFRSIFTYMVMTYYLEILGKTGGPPPHDKTIMASCWALVTKLLKTIFKEIHAVRMFASELGNVRDDPPRVNGLFLYAALKELRVLRDFQAYDYRRHPKYNQEVVLHLFDTSLPRSVYERNANGSGGDTLRLNRLEVTWGEHKIGINCLETVVGSIRSHLQLPGRTRLPSRRGSGSCCRSGRGG